MRVVRMYIIKQQLSLRHMCILYTLSIHSCLDTLLYQIYLTWLHIRFIMVQLRMVGILKSDTILYLLLLVVITGHIIYEYKWLTS